MTKFSQPYKAWCAGSLLFVLLLANGLRLGHQISQNHQDSNEEQYRVVKIKILHIALCDYHLGFGTLPVEVIFLVLLPREIHVHTFSKNQESVTRKIDHSFKRGPPVTLSILENYMIQIHN